MSARFQIDLRSWWIGFYVNTFYRELHVCILFIVITLALTRAQQEEF